jgi:hypothetical protein
VSSLRHTTARRQAEARRAGTRGQLGRLRTQHREPAERSALRARLGAEGRANAAEWNAGAYHGVAETNSRAQTELDKQTRNAHAAKVAIR